MRGVEVRAGGGGVGEQAAVVSPRRIHVMEADGVDAELGEPRGHGVRVVRGHERRIAGEVDSEKADSLAVDDEMAVGVRGDPVGADGRITGREIRHARSGVVPGQNERNARGLNSGNHPQQNRRQDQPGESNSNHISHNLPSIVNQNGRASSSEATGWECYILAFGPACSMAGPRPAPKAVGVNCAAWTRRSASLPARLCYHLPRGCESKWRSAARVYAGRSSRLRLLKASAATTPPAKSPTRWIQTLAPRTRSMTVMPTATAGLNAPPEMAPTA